MQPDVVSRLIPGFVLEAGSLGQGRIAIFAYEWESRWPFKYGLYLVEHGQLVGRLSHQDWIELWGFIDRIKRDAEGDIEVLWRLFSYRVRERGGTTD